MSIDSFSDPVFDAIKAHLDTNWTFTPLAYLDGFFDPAEGAPWVAIELSRALYSQASIGASLQADNRWDEEGTLYLRLMVPTGTAAGKTEGAAKALANLFRGKTLLSGKLEFLDADVDEGESVSDIGNWRRKSVSVEWRWMEAS